MIRGLYITASGMLTKQTEMENLSNNIANINTPGFKKEDVATKAFDKVLLENRDKVSNGRAYTSKIGELEMGVGIDATSNAMTQGIIEDTGNKFDFAIVGDGHGLELFNVQDDNGNIKYTRNGKFKLDSEGLLLTQEGYKVIGNNGQPIRLKTSDISLNNDGTIAGAQTSGVKFAISKFDAKDLQKDSAAFNCFIGNNPQTDNTSSVRQGCLEKSNVDPIQVVTQMISIMRSYESNQKVMQQMDETLGKTVNEVGRV